MSTTPSSTLIREFTAHKIQAAIETSRSVASQNHPFEESKAALVIVERNLTELLNRIQRPTSNDQLLRSACRLGLNGLEQMIPLIGFIERSTEVTGPVEFFGPFSKITRKLLNNNAKLVLSSTWVFNPHTVIYPDQVSGFIDFVFVGFPVSESDNAFLTPLAAHEVGHNLWNLHKLEDDFQPKVGELIVNLLKTEDYKNRFSLDFQMAANSHDLVGQASWFPAAFWASKQLQESFCDFLAMYLFGPSYLYAFSHFSCPGTASSDPKYPPVASRYEQLIEAAGLENWSLNQSMASGLFENFSRSAGINASQHDNLLLEIADKCRQQLAVEIRSRARQVVNAAGLLYNETETVKVKTEFENGLPSTSAKSLSAILNAGWDLFISNNLTEEKNTKLGFQKKDFLKLINELMLKSFEIFEIETELKTQSECSTQLPSIN